MIHLPHGTGKEKRIAVFATGTAADDARAAGADIVGSTDLVDQIQEKGASWLEADVCLATPETISLLTPIARKLGPKGLMPSAKLGTVVTDLSSAVKQARAGRVQYRMDAGSNLHVPLGKVTSREEVQVS